MAGLLEAVGGELRWEGEGEWCTCSDHYHISVHGSCLPWFINPQRNLPTTQKKE